MIQIARTTGLISISASIPTMYLRSSSTCASLVVSLAWHLTIRHSYIQACGKSESLFYEVCVFHFISQLRISKIGTHPPNGDNLLIRPEMYKVRYDAKAREILDEV